MLDCGLRGNQLTTSDTFGKLEIGEKLVVVMLRGCGWSTCRIPGTGAHANATNPLRRQCSKYASLFQTFELRQIDPSTIRSKRSSNSNSHPNTPVM